MKTINYLWIAPCVGLLNLCGCSTAPAPHSPPAGGTVEDTQPTQAAGGKMFYLNLTKNAPSVVGVGEEFTYNLTATPQSEASDVTIVDEVPAGATYISSEPEAVKEGNKLTWKFNDVNRGESKTVRVTVKAETQGQLVHCATAAAIPQVCISTLVGQAKLALRKTGPATAQVGQQVSYELVVQNTGNAPAKGVVVTDTLPDQLIGVDGQKEVRIQVGDLGPGQSKSLAVPVKATKRGKSTNRAVAVASNAEKASAEALVAVQESQVKLQIATKDPELLINKAALYEIQVVNTGDTSLSGVVLTDMASPETPIAAAEGANVNASTATWNIGSLQPGEKKNFALRLASKVPGRFTTTASVTSAEGPKDSGQATTTWQGVTGITLEMVDETDPIQIGETCKFTVRVTNQGASIDAPQVKIVATLPPELELVPNTVSDGGVVDGRKISWAVDKIGPKASVVRTYIVKGIKTGDARSAVSITTGLNSKSLDQHESTTVY